MASQRGFTLLAFLFPLNWGPRYSDKGRFPSSIEFSVIRSLIRIKAAISRILGRSQDDSTVRFSESERRLSRRYVAFSVREPLMEELPVESRPPVRLLWMVHPKDFEVFHHSVESVLTHLKNPVKEVVIISPDSAVTRAHLESRVKTDWPIRFFNDNDFMSKENWERLRKSIGNHAGWAASQLIKVNFILTGDSTPTLMVDSDTVLLADKQWMYSDGRQLLYFRWFDNPRYEKYLRYWGFEEMDSLRSFITHHTLFQPDLLRSLIDSTFGAHDLDTLVSAVVSGANALQFPEFCIDDEPYGQLLFKHYPEIVVLDKYSNANMSLPKNNESMLRLLQNLRKKGEFNSVSFHKPER